MSDIPFDYDQADWGSRKTYPDGALRPWTPDKMVIHWGGGPNPAGATVDLELEFEVLRGWQGWHIDGKGWYDIAYNYAVGNTGKIGRLRGENRAGATSGDYENDGIPENHEARAVVWIGGATQTPTPAAVQAMARIVEAGGHDTLIGHRDVKGVTTCPGELWLDWAHNYPGPVEETGMISKTSDKKLIKDLQTMLDELLKPEPPLGLDGIWGPKTQTQVDAAYGKIGWSDHTGFDWISEPALTLLALRHDHRIKAARSNVGQPL